MAEKDYPSVVFFFSVYFQSCRDCGWLTVYEWSMRYTPTPTYSHHFHCKASNRFTSVSSRIHSTNSWSNAHSGVPPCVDERGQGICTDTCSTWGEVGGVLGGHPALGLWVSLSITSFGVFAPKTHVVWRIASSREGLAGFQLHHHAASSFPNNKVHLCFLMY